MNRKTLKLFFVFGRPLAPLYSFIMRMRVLLYRRGVLKSTQLSIPVISVGNLTMGGSGKTPMVGYVAGLLQAAGVGPAIVSRGYGGRATGPVNVVSDGREILLGAGQGGDEPRMLAESLPGVPVLTGPRKAEVAEYAVRHMAPGAIVLDDGFQHLALARDLNLVLFDAKLPLGNGHVFPGGDLREPIKALQRAQVFIITGVDEDNRHRVGDFKRLLHNFWPTTPVFEGQYAAVGVVSNLPSDVLDLKTVGAMKLYGFCGIANPEGFKETLGENGLKLKGFKAFKDHHHYSLKEIELLIDCAKMAGAEGLITTEKDYVKLGQMIPANFRLLAIKRKVIMDKSFDQFLLGSVVTKLQSDKVATGY